MTSSSDNSFPFRKRGEILTSKELEEIIAKDNEKNNHIQNDYYQEIMPRWAIKRTQTISCFGRFCTDND
ncbi:MAG: hypothetical protein V1865_02725 [bacterium]